MGAYSPEQGERFHQNVMVFEQRYQGRYNEIMIGGWRLHLGFNTRKSIQT